MGRWRQREREREGERRKNIERGEKKEIVGKKR